jgi:hypothetical protein
MENCICNKKVQLVPIVRDSGWLDKGHDGKFLFSGAMIELDLKKDAQSGYLIDPLRNVTDKDKKKIVDAFALESLKDLSVHKKENNFWLDKQRKLRLDRNGMIFDLSNPIEFVHYCIACTYTDNFIAESWEERKNKLTYKFAFKDEDTVIESSAFTEKDKMKAYTKFGQMQTNERDMFDFLMVYHYKFKKKDMFPHYSWTVEKFIDTIGKVVEDDIKGFLKIIEDTNYKYRVLIYNALNQGLMEIVSKYKFQLKGSDRPIGSIEETIAYFSDSKNNEEYMVLKANVESKLRAVKV